MASDGSYFLVKNLLEQCVRKVISVHEPLSYAQVRRLMNDSMTMAADTIATPSPTGTDAVEVLAESEIFPSDYFSAWHKFRWILIDIIPISVALFIFVRYRFLWGKTTREQQKQYEFLLSSDPLKNLAFLMVPSLQVADYEFRGIQPPAQRIDLRFENLGLELYPSKRTVLKDVSGAFHSGHLSAIMGASGAGKSTFMNVLCGKAFYGTTLGKVFVNGDRMDVSKLMPVMGFVPQDDIVHSLLTVRENLSFSAQLRNPRTRTMQGIARIVNDVLTVLQIGHVQMSIVGSVESRGISGGQRKRVNIGLELAACPTLLFLDEPTSGLDATSSLSIIHSLKKMTELGMTIIMVIHQPRYSLFTLFDDVLLLGKGGQTVYQGESAKAKDYLLGLGFRMPANENPADWFIDVLSGEVTNEAGDYSLKKLFEKWTEKMAAQGDKNVRRAPTRFSFKADDMQVNELRSEIENAVEEAWNVVDAGDELDKEELHDIIRYCSPGKVQMRKVIQKFWDYILKHAQKELSPTAPSTSDVTHAVTVAATPPSNPEIGVTITKAELIDAMVELLRGKGTTMGMPADEYTGTKVEGVLDTVDQMVDRVGRLVASMLGRKDKEPEENTGEVQKSFNLEKMRKVPGAFFQFKILAKRRSIQWYRNTSRRMLDLAVISLAALILGIQHKDNTQRPSNIVLFHMALGMLVAVNCLSCLGGQRTLYWRERSHGLAASSYSFAHIFVNSLEVFAQSLAYVTVYYLVAQPALPFSWFMEPILCLAFVCSGWGYFISCIIPPQSATLTAVVLMILLNGALGDPAKMYDYLDGGFMEFVVMFCPTRWSVQMFYICWYKAFDVDPGLLAQASGSTGLDEAIEFINVYRSSWFDRGQDIRGFSPVDARGETTLDKIGNTYWTSGLLMLLAQGFILRFLTIPELIYRNRNEQK